MHDGTTDTTAMADSYESADDSDNHDKKGKTASTETVLVKRMSIITAITSTLPFVVVATTVIIMVCEAVAVAQPIFRVAIMLNVAQVFVSPSHHRATVEDTQRQSCPEP